jgi:hypothetical protein
MELMKAIEKHTALKDEIRKLDVWLSHTEYNNKPINGLNWVKVKKAVNDVISELVEEKLELEEKIENATNGIEIEHQ